MSWMKRPRGTPGADQQTNQPPPVANAMHPHQPPLPSNQAQPWMQNAPNNVSLPQGGYSYGNVNTSHPPPQQQQQFWQHQPQNANQQNAYNHNYNQQNYVQPQTTYPNEYYQYGQQYSSPNSNTYTQQNYAYNQSQLPNQQYNASQVHQQQNYSAPRSNFQGPSDQEANESDPWNWGWEDNAAAENQNSQKATVVQNVNANVLNESFTNSTEGWNYNAVDSFQNDSRQNLDKNVSNPPRTASRDEPFYGENLQNVNKDNSDLSKVADPGTFGDDANSANDSLHDQNTASFSSDSKQKISSKTPLIENRSGKTHIGNIPHGWSMESQPSQESSDGLLSHTESTTGSEDPSRSYDKVSPSLSASDNTNFNYSQGNYYPEVSYNQQVSENIPPSVEKKQAFPSDDNINQELVENVRSLNINKDTDNIVPNKNDQPNLLTEEASSANALHNLPVSIGRDSNSPNLPKPPMNLPPPNTNFPTASNTNPFKRTGQLSHRTINKSNPLQLSNDVLVLQQQGVPFQQEMSSLNLRQPPSLMNVDDINNAPSRNLQHVNLETTPDNSERPDNPSPVPYSTTQYPQHGVHQNVENCEVAPNDRNEYLQTGHLSEVGYNDNTNFRDNVFSDMINTSGAGSDNYPPPGLRRMVLGQPESQFNQNPNFSIDEPPPGLSRMIPGHPAGTINLYNESNDDYLDRQVDGQTTESDSITNSAYATRNSAVYRQIDGQPTDDESNYNQTISSRSSLDRRPVGFDRMVPGEASNNFNSTFQNQSFSGANEERVVTGFEQVNSSETREQNVDGSDYSEVDTNQIRNVVGATEPNMDGRNPDNSVTLMQNINTEPDLQRDRNMEGENLQDLSNISSTDFSMIRDQNVDGADTQEEPLLRKIDQDSESDRMVKSMSNQQLPIDKDRKYREDTTGDESERDRVYKMNSMRKEKEGSRHRSSRERDGRYERREERRTDKDRRGDYRNERDSLRGDDRRYRNKRDRYDTEDTDYYSDRDRRRYREGSYSSSKPSRSDERRRDDDRKSYERSRDDRDRRRRDDYDRDRRYDSYESERDGMGSRRRDKDRDYDDREDDRHRRYGTVERERNYRRDRGSRDDRKKSDPRYRGGRGETRDANPAEEETFDENSGREHRRDRRSDDHREYDRDHRSHRHRRDRERDRSDQYYERYGYPMDPYSQQLYQHQTYQYYEKLRMTNPQAYLEIYNKYMSGATQNLSQSDVSRAMSNYGEGYTSLTGYDPNASIRLADERGSVHSGRSSTNGEAIKDRMVMDGSSSYYYPYRRIDNPNSIYMKQDTPTRTREDIGSIRTDYSGSRDFNTDASLNQYLEDLTIKSERLTPVKFATAHIKGVLTSPNLVIINPSYPSDGQSALVEILNINKVLANDPIRCELSSYPGPLIKGTTHKKTIIEFCEMKIKTAIEKYSTISLHGQNISHNVDLGSFVLMWELLILLLRQNGMVVGTDIAELLIKNKNQYVWKGAPPVIGKGHSRRDSASSATSRSNDLPLEDNQQQSPHDNTGTHDGDHDSSNETSLHSTSGNKKERKSSKDISSNSNKMGRKTSSNLESYLHSQNEEKYVTDKFREYLLFGSGKDALEWAMSHNLWGHALFLASKLDRRTYANVMTRFANSLLPNDPLQTLYQLMSGRQPASVTCVLDEKWGDWRPHLAMILSNTSQRPDLDKKSIMTLGDTLQTRGDLFAAQFCYLMARVEFGKRPIKLQSSNTPTPRLVLLGSSANNENFATFASNEAIMMTEIYEYACSLNDDSFILLDFQFYKYLLGTRYMEYGFYDRALFYMEKIAQVVSQHSDKFGLGLLNNVLQIAERLKYYDPEEHVGDIANDDMDPNELSPNNGHVTQKSSESEQKWITNLRQIVQNLNMSVPMHETIPQITQSLPGNYDQNQYQIPYDQNQSWNQYAYNSQLQQQQIYNQQSQNDQYNKQFSQEQQYPDQYTTAQTTETDSKQNDNYEQQSQQQMFESNYSQNASLYYSPGSLSYSEHDHMSSNDNQQTDYPQDSGYWNSENQSTNQQSHSGGYEPEPVNEKPLPETTDNEVGDVAEQPRPQISMPNTVKSAKSPYYAEDQDVADNANQKSQSANQQKSKEKPKKEDAASNKNHASSGWFGGIFNKLSLKPKNQMILPDDKNPTIVWDPDKKRWMNLEADGEEQESQLAPPPQMTDLLKQNPSFPSQNQLPPQQTGLPPDTTGAPMLPAMNNSSNIFKLQKGRHIKKSYVDVFNPSGAPTRPLPPASEVLGATQPTTTPPTFFVPQASNGNDQSGQMAPSFYNPSDFAS